MALVKVGKGKKSIFEYFTRYYITVSVAWQAVRMSIHLWDRDETAFPSGSLSSAFSLSLSSPPAVRLLWQVPHTAPEPPPFVFHLHLVVSSTPSPHINYLPLFIHHSPLPSDRFCCSSFLTFPNASFSTCCNRSLFTMLSARFTACSSR